MRPIKFKCGTDIGCFDVERIFFHEDGDMVILGKGGEKVDTSEDGGIKLLQFTGLQDKTGKDIYEGDLVEGGGVVEYGLQDIGHDWQGIGFYIKEKDGDINGITGDIVITGNIYE